MITQLIILGLSVLTLVLVWTGKGTTRRFKLAISIPLGLSLGMSVAEIVLF